MRAFIFRATPRAAPRRSRETELIAGRDASLSREFSRYRGAPRRRRKYVESIMVTGRRESKEGRGMERGRDRIL